MKKITRKIGDFSFSPELYEYFLKAWGNLSPKPERNIFCWFDYL
jgi:hypothetical protein